MNNIGIYHVLIGGAFRESVRKNLDIYRKVDNAVKEWRKEFYSKTPPGLFMTEGIFGLILLDSRPCAQEKSRILLGLNASIYRLAWEPVSLVELLNKLPDYTEEAIREVLEDLIRKKLMIFLSGKYLALAVWLKGVNLNMEPEKKISLNTIAEYVRDFGKG